jgi:hypothetical protein
LLYWYKSTNTDAARWLAAASYCFTHLTCFTGTKVQILTLRASWQLHLMLYVNNPSIGQLQVLTLLALLLVLLVQKYQH